MDGFMSWIPVEEQDKGNSLVLPRFSVFHYSNPGQKANCCFDIYKSTRNSWIRKLTLQPFQIFQKSKDNKQKHVFMQK